MLLSELAISDVTFHVSEDREGDNNRGFRVDRIEAKRDGKVIGYIQVSYIPSERFKKFYTSLEQYTRHIAGGHPPSEDPETRKRQERAFRDFEHYHVDKPFVEFIRVMDEIDGADRSYRRQGLGLELYKQMFKYLKRRGLKLYASNLQSDEAKAAWDKMEKIFVVKREMFRVHRKDVERRYLAALR